MLRWRNEFANCAMLIQCAVKTRLCRETSHISAKCTVSGRSYPLAPSPFSVLIYPDSVGRRGCLPVYAAMAERVCQSPCSFSVPLKPDSVGCQTDECCIGSRCGWRNRFHPRTEPVSCAYRRVSVLRHAPLAEEVTLLHLARSVCRKNPTLSGCRGEGKVIEYQ